MAIKKNNFYCCDACHRKYADIGMQAPKNNFKFKILCKGCFKKYFSNVPLPSSAAAALKTYMGAFLPPIGTNIISTDGSSLINQDGASLINQDGASFNKNTVGILTNTSSNLINQDGASFGRKT